MTALYRPPRPMWILPLLVLLAACDTGGEPDTAPAAVQLAFEADGAFVVDNTVAVSATVTNAGGDPLSGVAVEWSVEGGGSVAPARSTTGADGVARTEWTLGTSATGAAAQTIRAAVASAAGVGATEAVAVNPGAVDVLEVAADTTRLEVGGEVEVRVERAEDAFGNEIDLAAYSFAWSSSAPEVAAVKGTGATAVVRGVGVGEAEILVTSGAAPGASFEAARRVRGAAADTLGVRVVASLVELRGVWLTNVASDVLDSRESIAEAMQFLADHHFNVVYPVVWNAAATLYPSDTMENLIGRRIDPRFRGRDPLQEVIEEAHARGLAVIPWFEYGFAASYNAGGGPILTLKPEWAARDRDGRLLKKNGFEWMNPYHPEVQGLLMDLIMEVTTGYDVDGIQGDDRLPANPVEGGYSAYTVELYKAEHGGAAPPRDFRDPAWVQWRADKLSAFGERVYDAVKAVDPLMQVSWSPSVYPWSKQEYLQDWPAWIRGGYADLVHPQNYRYTVEAYRATLESMTPAALGLDPDVASKIYPGILMRVGDYTVPAEALKQELAINRELGFNGEVFFFYEGLRVNNGALADTLLATFYRDPARLPFRLASE